MTGTLSAGAPATVTDATAAWPTLGLRRSAVNADALAGRMAAGVCSPSTLTVDVTSSEGSVQMRTVLDPRPGSGTVVTIADKPVTLGPDAVTTASFVADGSGSVTDVDVRIDELRHTYLGDLEIELLHDGVSAFLIDNLNAGAYDGDDILGAIFDSDSPTTIALPAAGPISGRSRPQTANALDVFDGRPAAGTWTLRITDTYPGDAGELRRWGLDSPQIGCGRLEIPAVQTQPASVAGPDAATLNGSVTPNGRATGLRFAYGTTSDYGQTTAVQDVGAGDAAVAGSSALGGLDPSTTYHYRVESIREGGQVAVAGADQTFTTPAVGGGPPAVDPPVGGPPAVSPPPLASPPFDAPPTALDVAAPLLGGARVTLARVSRRRSARRRATIAFTLSEPATETAAVTRAAPGIKAADVASRSRPAVREARSRAPAS